MPTWLSKRISGGKRPWEKLLPSNDTCRSNAAALSVIYSPIRQLLNLRKRQAERLTSATNMYSENLAKPTILLNSVSFFV